MRLESIEFGFVETIENDVVEKIVCKYTGTCTVYFYDKPPLELNVGCSSYNYQYGIPISEDGTRMFVGSWEKGLCAYDIVSGDLLWKFKARKIRNILVYSKFLIVSRANTAVVKIDIDTGEVLASIKSGTIEHVFGLDSSHIFADTISGKYCAIDVGNMVVAKKYASRVINPFECLSLIVTNVVLQQNIVTIFGIEQHPRKTLNSKMVIGGTSFSRIIDTNFDKNNQGTVPRLE